MICVAHSGNTIDKQQFNTKDLELDTYDGKDKIDILNKILCIK